MTDAGIQFIREREGCKLTAYQCPAGIWTIGYGSTKDVKEGQTITQEQADRLFFEELGPYALEVSLMVKADLKPNQMDALTSFAYNCGVNALRNSTLLKKVNAQAPIGEIKAEFMKWTKGGGKVLPGLVARRKAEAEMYAG